jgi:hypothetical protein
MIQSAETVCVSSLALVKMEHGVSLGHLSNR